MLKDSCLGGSTVVVGRDARHQSDDFALATAEVLAAEGFSVVLLPDPAPTPVVAFAVRHLRAAAGVQITASHNPPADNGYKVYLDGGLQIVPPTDRDIESAMASAPADIARSEVSPVDTDLVHDYVQRAATVRRTTGDVRVALTPMHGVGGEIALHVLSEAGITDVHTVAEQFAPDPDFPTVAFPNPEEPGATDLLLALAAEVDAEVAIALDPDADRCAVAVPTPTGWRMLSGDETGWLLGDYVLSQTEPGDVMAASVVASTVVSSRMLAAIAASHGARHVETLTGFKWLARADAGLPGSTLVYAYEEAIGHCVDPAAVRDKDGISAAVLVCDLVAALRDDGPHPARRARRIGPRARRAHDDRGVGARRRDGDGRGCGPSRLPVWPARRHGRRPVAPARPEADRRRDPVWRRRRTSVRVASGRRAPSRRSRRTWRFAVCRATTSRPAAPWPRGARRIGQGRRNRPRPLSDRGRFEVGYLLATETVLGGTPSAGSWGSSAGSAHPATTRVYRRPSAGQRASAADGRLLVERQIVVPLAVDPHVAVRDPEKMLWKQHFSKVLPPASDSLE